MLSESSSPRNLDRRAKILEQIRQSGTGLEIGPSHSPLASKSEGFDVRILDHLDRAGLVQKYASHGVNVEAIEDVDYVWKGETYHELVGERSCFDWILASHIIEHTPDLIRFLADCEGVLKADGVLSLAIPDKRFCFDAFRPITGLARIVDSHLGGFSVQSPGTVAEFYMNVISKGGNIAWEKGTDGPVEFIHGAEEALEKFESVRRRGTYYDVHSWVFVPSSFRLLLLDLHQLGFTKLKELSFSQTVGSEFFVTLSLKGSGPDCSREELLLAIERELAESGC